MNPVHILKQYFGYDSFREGQELLVQSILEGKDSFGVMPTGAGKSICYQVPAIAMEGITIVVSPLISLMKDQVAALNQAGVHAAYINSSLSARQVSMALQYAKEGRYKLIYVAPERLETEEFLDFASLSNISMVTVDEAHCISQWGQDFRPSYLKITKFINQLPRRPIISGFTATATKEVMEDVICSLQLSNPTVLVTGFDRSNLYFEVRSPKDKNSEVVEYVNRHHLECGIIYCATRKNVDELQELLRKEGILAARYHAGMSDQERNQNQEDFIYDKKPVIIATNAFGMGIDKSNVRYVIHYNMPKNMESYYQEAGRAGRDGEPSECILLFAARDIQINQFLIENGNENQEIDPEQYELIRERDEERLKKMTYYCYTKDCLREYILNYFGQFGESGCDNCSNCLTQFEEANVTEISRDIIGCIKESGQRYGINVIISTLLGSKAAKLSSIHMFENSFYSKRATEKEHFLKQIMNKLIIDGYLYLTNDKYTVVKIDKSAQGIITGDTVIIMKCSRDNLSQQKTTVPKAHRSKILKSKGIELFELLRQVRTRLAREIGMPPYIIFSDKTLTDMCIKLPLNKNEMLSVQGVGANKYDKYGSDFLEAILDFTKGEKLSLSYEPSKTEEPVRKKSSPKKGTKDEFYLTQELLQSITMEGEVMISQFVEQLNQLRDENKMKRLTSTSLTTRLREEDYLIEKYNPAWGRNITIATEKGSLAGIKPEKRISDKGNEYEVLLYNEEAQRLLLSLIPQDVTR